MKIVVLVTTMNRNDLSIYKEMNLQTDAVIANQTDRNEILEQTIDGHNVRFVCTDSRGVSRNRNIAMAHFKQDADIVVFADDDLVFNEGYAGMIAAEFEAHPKAEAIKFNLHDLSEKRQISMKRIAKYERATRRNMSSSGVWALAVRSRTLNSLDLKFDERFGPGSDYLCGEDTIYIMRMIDRGVSFFRSPVDVAGIDQTESSWFTGNNDAYFKTAGSLLYTLYPIFSVPLAVRGAYKAYKRRNSELSFFAILNCYIAGIKDSHKRKKR